MKYDEVHVGNAGRPVIPSREGFGLYYDAVICERHIGVSWWYGWATGLPHRGIYFEFWIYQGVVMVLWATSRPHMENILR
jgi:hypothetical protein